MAHYNCLCLIKFENCKSIVHITKASQKYANFEFFQNSSLIREIQGLPGNCHKSS